MVEETGDVIVECLTCRSTGKRWRYEFNYLTKKTIYKERTCRACGGSGYLEMDWVSAVYNQPKGNIIYDRFGLSVDKQTVNIKTRKLRTNWTLEVQQDIMSLAAENLAREIDKEIVNMLTGELKNKINETPGIAEV